MLKSDRLTHIAQHVRQNAPMADIGTDHALLPRFLVQKRIVPRAIAIEVNRGPYDMARRYVKECGLSEQIDVRLADGLEGLHPGEVETIVIAGMGGALIERILKGDKGDRNILRHTKRLVLQPNVAARRLRQWMLTNEWQLTHEDLVFEKGHFYDILVAEHGSPLAPYSAGGDAITQERLVDTGPLLWRQKHPLLRVRLESEVAKWERILHQMRHTQKNREKQVQVKRQIRDWKEMIQCLPRESISSASSRNGSLRI